MRFSQHLSVDSMKSNSILRFVWISVILLGFLATGMLLLPALIYNDENAFSGLQVAFGYQFSSLGPWVSGDIEFSIMNTIAYFLPMFGSLCLIVRKNGLYIPIGAYLLSIVMLSVVPIFTEVTVTVLGNETSVNIDWSLGMGLTLAILFSIFAIMGSLYILSYRIDKKKNKNVLTY